MPETRRIPPTVPASNPILLLAKSPPGLFLCPSWCYPMPDDIMVKVTKALIQKEVPIEYFEKIQASQAGVSHHQR